VLLEGVGSETADATVTELVITVPGAVPAITVKTKLNVEVAFANIDALEHETVVEFTKQVQPDGTVSDENVVFAGMVSTAVTVVAVAGPLLATTAV
jgi:hypothetical protein